MNPPDNPFAPGSPSTGSGKSASTSKMTPLADDFHPGNDDVICGRGKKCYNHIGNTRFRQRVIGMLDDYANAKSKLDKSGVLSRVMADVRRASPGGGFVKQDESGKWFEVGDFLAREKTSQAFRDALHERYKSSNVSKKKRRQQELAKASDKAQRIARSEQEMSARLERLSSDLIRSATNTPPGMASAAAAAHIPPIVQPNAEMLKRLSSLASRQLPSRSASLRDPRFPDPLFGRSSVVNAAPGSAFSQMESISRPSQLPSAPIPQRSHSFSHPGHQRVAIPPLEALHNSLPNVHISEGIHADPHDPRFLAGSFSSLNQSLPNLYEGSGRVDFNTNTAAMHAAAAASAGGGQQIEPIPLDYSQVSPLAREKSDLKKPPQQGGGGGVNSATQAGLSKSEAADKELLECLSKMTEHSISDDNPFEPIPIATGATDSSTGSKKEYSPMDVSSAGHPSYTFGQDLNDESEQEQEFAEG